MPGRASSRKNSAPIVFINIPEEEWYEEEVQPHRKTDYTPFIYIYIYMNFIAIQAIYV